jgi:phosphoglycerate dehydrogenase-like enzyme
MNSPVLVLGAPAADELDALRGALGGDFEVRNADSVSDAMQSAHYLVVRDQPADTRALRAAPRLRAVIRLDSGSAEVDEEECRRRGIAVYIVHSPTIISVAEHTVLLILALIKRFETATSELRAGTVVDGMKPALTTQTSYAYNWVGLTGFDALYGKRIGLIGLGKIGRETAIRLRAFGVDVTYTKRTPLSAEEDKALGVRFLSRDELLRVSDCVSLHHRFDGSVEHYMDRRAFGLMKHGAYLVNTARGRLVDEEALRDALQSGRLAGAALDVFQYEPLPGDSPLLRTKNLILTPHVGGIPSHASSLAEFGEAANLIRKHHGA